MNSCSPKRIGTDVFTMLVMVVASCCVSFAGCDALNNKSASDDLTEGTLHEDQALQHASGARQYHFYESGAEGPRPLVIVLHGGGATIDAFIGQTGGAAPFAGVWLALAEEEGFHVAVPQGLGEHWNDCRSDCTHCGDQDDAGFLLALRDALTAEYDIDQNRVYVVGESNGGFMTQRMAQEHAGEFAGYGVVVASMPANNQCRDSNASASLVYVVGTEDVTVQYEGGPAALAASGSMLSSDESVAWWMSRNGCEMMPDVEQLEDLDTGDSSTVEKHTWSCTNAGLARYKINGGGHVVPSIQEQVSRAWETLVGNQNHDMETAREMWRFFSEQ